VKKGRDSRSEIDIVCGQEEDSAGVELIKEKLDDVCTVDEGTLAGAWPNKAVISAALAEGVARSGAGPPNKSSMILLLLDWELCCGCG